eukprot:CAMPEP_0170563220 /NCGR_PEP_ID=MMETSP0211-20121228/65169_1 /TAXON_ID=311385 /ORGANISM="Pseudokeronopsis sp., Strain OXSARD2" /LENGTH=157 /DNA_ID=CAMNT_0010881167 /DNA_START=52 /DNA_END=522 /DNA_ORIENTATION=+
MKHIDPNSIKDNDIEEFIPNVPPSLILKYNEMVSLFRILPEYARMRVPTVMYQSQNDGFNLKNLYRVCHNFKDEYRFTLMLVQTSKNQVFGAFIDAVFCPKPKPGKYIGSSECFVFTVKPKIRAFHDKGANLRYLLGEYDYFTVGGEGDGPAIRINE